MPIAAYANSCYNTLDYDPSRELDTTDTFEVLDALFAGKAKRSSLKNSVTLSSTETEEEGSTTEATNSTALATILPGVHAPTKNTENIKTLEQQLKALFTATEKV